MSEPKYPAIEVQLSGQDGNAFVIIGRISSAMKYAGVPAAEREQFQREATSGDYNNVLQTAMKWVSIS